MPLPEIPGIEPRFLSVLRHIVARLKDSGIEWAITGSLGMALQGMELPVHDIDLQTDAAGARMIERLFVDSIVRPVAFTAKGRIRSLLGAFEMQGVMVEIIGDMQKHLDSGDWEEPVRVRDHLLWVNREGMQLPVLSLEHEYHAYLLMGRLEKARMILDWLRRSGRPAPPASPTVNPKAES